MHIGLATNAPKRKVIAESANSPKHIPLQDVIPTGGKLEFGLDTVATAMSLYFNADTMRIERSSVHEPKRNRNVFLDVKPIADDANVNVPPRQAARRNATVFNNRVGFPPLTPKEAFVDAVPADQTVSYMGKRLTAYHVRNTS